MPVIVINEMDNWRKIRDIEGGESWVRSVALSGEDRGLVTTQTPLMKTNKPAARILAQLSPNVLIKLKSCGPEYCAVEIDPEVKKGKKKGRKGYVARRDIWGVDGF
jgi:SH3-like domain-containing protein